MGKDVTMPKGPSPHRAVLPPSERHATGVPGDGATPFAAKLAALKGGRSVSVCIPALDEAPTIGPIVEVLRRELVERSSLVDEILVIDDGSTDETVRLAREAGADVVRAAGVLEEHGRGRGKGRALWKSVHACRGDLIVFCDADVVDFGTHFVTAMLAKLLVRDDVALVKGTYERPLDGVPRQGGRVTELVARPVLSLVLPELARLGQPLAGEAASRREVLEQLPFSAGYGVEIGLLIEVAKRFGTRAIEEVDLGSRTHRNRTLEELGPQALAVLEAALRKAGLLEGGAPTLTRPGRPPEPVEAAELPPLRELAEYRERRRRGGATTPSPAAPAS
jgi:glucosyl-3-phosphoglycerate synthase